MRTRNLAALLLLALSACGSCKGKEAAPAAAPASRVPAGASRAALATDLARLGGALGELEKTRLAGLLAAAAGKQTTEELAGPIVRQLGFDPRSPEGIAGAGIDAARGLAVTEDAGTQLLILAVADRARMEAYLGALAQRVSAGAPAREVPLEGGATARAHGPEGAPPRVAWVIAGGHAMVAQGGDPLAALGRAVALKPEQSLESSPAYARAVSKLGKPDVIVWSAPGARAFPGAPKAGGALGISLTRSAISLRAVALQTPESLAALRAAGQVAGGELVAHLPESTFLALRLGGDPGALQPLLEGFVSEKMLARLAKAGVDLRTDVLGQLKPGVVIGLGLSSDIDLSAGLPTGGDALDVNRTNPFRFVDLTVYAKVKDPAAAKAVLERMSAVGEQLRFEVASRKEKDLTVWSSRYAGGDGMTWALSGDTLVATGGKDAFPRAVARLAAPQPPFAISEPKVKATFDAAASAAYLDVPRLTAAMRGIPEYAYGVGGFRIKQVVEGWVQMLDEVKGVAATFSVDDAVILDAELALK